MRYGILISLGVVGVVILIFFTKYQSCINEKNTLIEINNKNEAEFNQTLENIRNVKINTQKKINNFYAKNIDTTNNIADDFLLSALQD